jgi:glucose dehydrogenase
MPFRRWFTERGADHPAAYSMLTLALGMVVCMVIAVSVSISASNRNTRESLARERAADARADEKAQAVAAAARAAFCLVFERIDQAYQIDPPTTPAGKNVAEAWASLADSPFFRCTEGK